jgi:hypothetical protein
MIPGTTQEGGNMEKRDLAFMFAGMNQDREGCDHLQVISHSGNVALMAANGFVVHHITGLFASEDLDFVSYYSYDDVKLMLSAVKVKDNIQITDKGIIATVSRIQPAKQPIEFPGNVCQRLIDLNYIQAVDGVRLNSAFLVNSVKHFPELPVDFAFCDQKEGPIRLRWEAQLTIRTAYLMQMTKQ